MKGFGSPELIPSSADGDEDEGASIEHPESASAEVEAAIEHGEPTASEIMAEAEEDMFEELFDEATGGEMSKLIERVTSEVTAAHEKDAPGAELEPPTAEKIQKAVERDDGVGKIAERFKKAKKVMLSALAASIAMGAVSIAAVPEAEAGGRHGDRGGISFSIGDRGHRGDNLREHHRAERHHLKEHQHREDDHYGRRLYSHHFKENQRLRHHQSEERESVRGHGDHDYRRDAHGSRDDPGRIIAEAAVRKVIDLLAGNSRHRRHGSGNIIWNR